MESVGVQHHKDIIHVIGQDIKQFLAVEQFIVLLLQAVSVAADQIDQHDQGQHDGNARHHDHGGILELAHTGVHRCHRHHSQHYPVLKADRLINQIVFHIIQPEAGHSGAVLPEVLLERLHLIRSQARIHLQGRNKVMDPSHLLTGIVHQHTAIRVNDIAAGLAIKGRYLQCTDQIAVIEANGNCFIVKAPVAARPGGHSKH